MKERIAYYDLLRGIAIIGVVAIHSSWIGLNYESNSYIFWGTVVWRQIINFSVPLFLALSGYFIGEKIISTKQEYFHFLKRKLPRVLIPYFIWSLLYLSPDFYHHAPVKAVIVKFLTFQTSMPFYFILLIIQFYLLLPLFQKMITKTGLYISSTISLISCIIIFFIRYYTDLNLPLYLYAGASPTWMIFFTLGLYLRKYNLYISAWRLNLFIIVFFLLTILETLFIYKNYHEIENAVTAIKFSAFCFSFVVILQFFNNSKLKIENYFKPVMYIGEISFGIYLCHMFVLRYVYVFLNRGFLHYNTLILQIFTLSLTILICTVLIYYLRKYSRHIPIHYLGM